MDQHQIRAFIEAMAASDLNEMDVSHEGWSLRLVRGRDRGDSPREPGRNEVPPPQRTAAEDDSQPAPATHSTRLLKDADLRAPMSGIVYLQQAPDQPAFVKVGDLVEDNQVVCIIEAMKVFNEVRAEHAGRLTRVHVATGAEVDATSVLMTIEPVRDV